MANDFRFEDGKPAAKMASSAGNNCLPTCLIICGVFFVVLVILGGISAWFVSRNWKPLASSIATRALGQAIDEVDQFTDQQKTELKAEVDRLAQAFTDGRLSPEKLGEFTEKFFESPLLGNLIVSVIEQTYLESSGLSDEEKTAGHRTLQRFSRGCLDGAIKESELDDVLQHVADRKQDGQWQIRNKLTDEELRKFLEAAKAKADAADVPDQDFDVDPVQEFRRLVDEALQSDAEKPEPKAEGRRQTPKRRRPTPRPRSQAAELITTENAETRRGKRGRRYAKNSTTRPSPSTTDAPQIGSRRVVLVDADRDDAGLGER